MKLAIASGKGGTGKSTVAANLAYVISKSGQHVTLADCDVECPNLHLFFQSEESEVIDVSVRVPVIDASACKFCGKCSEMCRYNAISVFPGHSIVFPELCHSCGGCVLICPEHAITEKDRNVGIVKITSPEGYNNITLITGILNENERSSVPVINRVKSLLDGQEITIIDMAPGTSCNMVSGVSGCDYCALVTDPTPFGLHDLRLAVEVLRKLKVPCGVIINRSVDRDSIIEDYCSKEGIEIIGKIPYDPAIARIYSNGGLPAEKIPGVSDMLVSIYNRIVRKGGQ